MRLTAGVTGPEPVDATHRYRVHGSTTGAGTGELRARNSLLTFDASPRQGTELPGPADLLAAAFAACILKNVERMGEILPFSFDRAALEVTAERQDRPPRITRISYALTVVTDEPDHRVELLHRNIERHGTIFNTLADVCEVQGTIVALRPDAASDQVGPD